MKKQSSHLYIKKNFGSEIKPRQNAKNIVQYVVINSMAFIAFLTPTFIEKPIGSFSKQK